MSEGGDFFVRFWGVRGSIACPGPQYARYGGNTSCLELRCSGELVILDAGTGLRELGLTLEKQSPIDASLFLTHTHIDHIAGIPFFRPFFAKGNRFRLWAGNLRPKSNLHDVLCKFMSDPLFPVPPAVFGAHLSFHDFAPGDTLSPHKDLTIRTAALNHPNGATGYRIEHNGKSICYVTDTEHREGERDPEIMALIADADLLIYDSSYTDDEYPDYRDWGHSTWQEGVRLSNAANVSKLILFHHDPSHDDDMMDAIAAEAEAARPGTLVAREGMVVRP